VQNTAERWSRISRRAL